MGRLSLHQHATWPQAPHMGMFIFASEHGQEWKVQRRTHAKTERRSCRVILPSPMLLRCSFAVPKLPSTYSRTHSTMKEEHNERAGGERGAERRLSYIAMQVTHANLLLRSSPAHYRTYQRDPKVHWPGWPAGSTSRPRVRRRGRRAGPREIAVLVTPTLPILPPPPPVMPPVVVVVPSVPSVPTRVAVVVGEGASSPPARMRGRGRSSRRRETRARARRGERGRGRRGAARAAARARARAAACAAAAARWWSEKERRRPPRG